jgi:hypothetical protein
MPRLAHDISGPHVPVLAMLVETVLVETVVPTAIDVVAVEAEVALAWLFAPPPPAPLSTTTVEPQAGLVAMKRKARTDRRTRPRIRASKLRGTLST